MIRLSILIFSCFLVKHGINSQFSFEQSDCDDLCPGVDLNNVDLHALNGFWNRWASIPFSWQKRYECGFVNFFATTRSTAELHEISRIHGKPSELVINVLVRPDGDETVFIRRLSVMYRQRVVYADENAVLILTCLPRALNRGNGKGIYGWIATSSWDTTEEMVEPAFMALESCGIPRAAMIRQNNTGCAASYSN